MHLKNKLKKQQIQYSVPGPGPVLAAPLRPHCVPEAGCSSAEATGLFELPVSVLCPAGQCKNITRCIKPANYKGDFNQTVCVRAYLSEKLRHHFHVIVSLGHLLHTISAKNWPEKDFLLTKHKSWQHITYMQ